MDKNVFTWDGNLADGSPTEVLFEQLIDPINPDGDPDVQITATVRGTRMKALVIPGNALLAFVADLIRDARIDELREMDDEEILGLPEGAIDEDYEEV